MSSGNGLPFAQAAQLCLSFLLIVFWMLCIFYFKTLPLIFIILQALLREGSMPAPFDDISYLGVHIESLVDDIVPTMVSLLRGMPNLKTLYVKCDPPLLIQKPKVSSTLSLSLTPNVVYYVMCPSNGN